MPKHKWKVPANALQYEPPSGKHLRPSFADQKPLIFGFSQLDLDRSKFACSSKDGEPLLKVIKCLCHFSSYNQMQMGTTKNYHLLDDSVIKKHQLQDFQQKSPSKKLHQMGKKANPERIVGFFDSDPNNLFQVCILDLFHQIHPE